MLATFFEARLGGHGAAKTGLSDGTEKHDQNMLYMGRFDGATLRYLRKTALCRYYELCVLPTRGVPF